jgi:hypothetical protein
MSYGTPFYTRTLFIFPNMESPDPGVSPPAAAADGVEPPSPPSCVFESRPAGLIGLVCGVFP